MAKGRFIVVIGASAGGTVVLPELLSQFTPEMDIAVFVVVHVSKRSIGQILTDRLQQHTHLTCKIPEHNQSIETQCLYVARPDHHMMIRDNKILLGKGPMENRYRPSIDALFRSAAVHHGAKTIGIILSGLLEDGSLGMMAIKRSGGSCIVQLPEEAKYPDMPLSVLQNIKVDYSVGVKEMGPAVKAIMKKPARKTRIPPELKKEAEIAEKVNIGIEYVRELGEHSLYSCPDCGGGLWEIGTKESKGYRCHVGHVFTEDALLGAMEASTETALWTALRIIEERKNLLSSIASKEERNGKLKMVDRYTKRIGELQTQIDQLKKVLFYTTND
jgi:two-component system, chemotaxis family, protein-glutamate methylesterase/glutaminase